MNTNVLEYLSQKKNDFTTWLEENKENIARRAKQIAATGLAAATIMATATGCDLIQNPNTSTNIPTISGPTLPSINNTQDNNNNNNNVITGDVQDEQGDVKEGNYGDHVQLETPLPIIPEINIENIDKSQLTAEDVLNLYDNIALQMIRHHYHDYKAEIGENWDNINAQFVSLDTNVYIDRDGKTFHNMPFYGKLDEWRPSVQSWLDNENIMMYDMYTSSINIVSAINTNGLYEQFHDIGITENDLMNDLIVPMSSELFVIGVEMFNDENFTSLHFSPLLIRLKRIAIGNTSWKSFGCFKHVREFVIDGLESLESVKIGGKCFRIGDEERDDGVCRITNCPNLRQLEIGDESFQDSKSFELSNVNSLQSIKFGGYCFFYADISLKGE